jgi:hypothetical protein
MKCMELKYVKVSAEAKFLQPAALPDPEKMPFKLNGAAISSSTT